MTSQILEKYVPDIRKARFGMLILTGWFAILGLWLSVLGTGLFSLLLPIVGIIMVILFPKSLEKTSNSLEFTADGVNVNTKKNNRIYQYSDISYLDLKGIFRHILVVKLVNGLSVTYIYPKDPNKLIDTFNTLKVSSGLPNNGVGKVTNSPAATAKASTLSILAFTFAFFFPIIGMILGYVAKREILQSNGKIGGLRLAKAAIVISASLNLIALLGLFFWFLVLFG